MGCHNLSKGLCRYIILMVFVMVLVFCFICFDFAEFVVGRGLFC